MEAPNWMLYVSPIVGFLFLAVSLVICRFGVRHYASTGSWRNLPTHFHRCATLCQSFGGGRGDRPAAAMTKNHKGVLVT
jgi:hypothetical protein